VTGQQTTKEVSSGLAVMDIEGQQIGGVIADMTITVKARAGSDSIDLSQTVIEMTDGTTKTLLTYHPANNQFNLSSQFGGSVFQTTNWNETNSEFGILVLQDEDNSLSVTNPVINRGDIVMLLVNSQACFGGLSPRDNVWGTVSPEIGAPGIFAFRVPSSLTAQVYDLY